MYLLFGFKVVFNSTFIKSVDFYGRLVQYLYIYLFGEVIYTTFQNIKGRIFRRLYSGDVYLFLINIPAWIIGLVISIFLERFVHILILILICSIFFSITLDFILLMIITMFIVIPFSIAIRLLFESLIISFREDILFFESVASMSISTFVTIGFSLLIFPENIRYLFEVLFPIADIIEKLRKLTILKFFNLNVLILAIITSFVGLIISISVFNNVINYTKKSGKLFLK